MSVLRSSVVASVLASIFVFSIGVARAEVPVYGPEAPASLPLEKSEPTKIASFETAPVIDGKLDEPLWEHAAVLKDFYQIQPGYNIQPT